MLINNKPVARWCGLACCAEHGLPHIKMHSAEPREQISVRGLCKAAPSSLVMTQNVFTEQEHQQASSDIFHSDAYQHWSSCPSVTRMNAMTSNQSAPDEIKSQVRAKAQTLLLLASRQINPVSQRLLYYIAWASASCVLSNWHGLQPALTGFCVHWTELTLKLGNFSRELKFLLLQTVYHVESYW